MKKPIVAVSLREQVYQQLCDAIIRGEYAPGEALKISEIAEASGTSLVPVREAMQNLAAEGAIEMLHNRSARIPRISRADFAHLTSIRVSLEGMAAELAAPRLTDDDIAKLLHSNAGMIDAVAARSIHDVLLWNQEFHFGLYARAGSPMLERLIKILWLQAGPMLNASMAGKMDGMIMHQSGLNQHAEILDAARRRDRDLLKLTVGQDISKASEWYLRNYAFTA